MKVSDIAKDLALEIITAPAPEKEVVGVYSGDLLSWVMGRLKEGEAWVTIMNNVNIVAVASLADASCIILTESSEISEEVITKANQNEINIFRTDRTTYEMCCLLGKLLK